MTALTLALARHRIELEHFKWFVRNSGVAK